MNDCYGCQIVGFERGKVCEKKNGPLYKVESYTRDGIVSRWIEAVQGEYQIGDNVYFFMFDDGRGMILGGMID